MGKPQTKDSLGDRCKRYEASTQFTLLPRSPLFLRVDGRAFHTWTKQMGCVRPYDLDLITSMIEATRFTADEMSGFKLAYVQSDEATFMLTDYDTVNTQGWFGYNLNKVVSICASAFTARFNQVYPALMGRLHQGPGALAMFDCRAFTVPENDAANVFLWRQKDWVRNSVQMLAQAHFSHKELHKKKVVDMHEMLHGKGVNWTNQPDVVKNGAYVLSLTDVRYDIQPHYPHVETLLNEALGRTR